MRNGLSIIIAALLAIAFATAIPMPMPVSGHTSVLGGTIIRLTDSRTGEVITDRTTREGDYLIETANMKQGVRSGDTLTLQVDGCSAAECTQTVHYTGQDSITVNFENAPQGSGGPSGTAVGIGAAIAAVVSIAGIIIHRKRKKKAAAIAPVKPKKGKGV